MLMLVHSMFSQSSLKLSSLKNIFLFFLFGGFYYCLQVTYSFFYIIQSVLIPSSVFFSSVVIFFNFDFIFSDIIFSNYLLQFLLCSSILFTEFSERIYDNYFELFIR